MRSQQHWAGSVSFALFLLFGARAACADTYYVRAGGNDRADGKTAQTAFRTVLRAAQVLNYGDSIVIGPGTYRARVFFAERFAADGSQMSVAGDESGKLTGDAAGPVVIEPSSLAAPALRFHRFRNLVVSGLTFRGPGDGLVFDKCLAVRVERCTFTGLRQALNAKTTDGLRVESCVFDQNTVGISLQATANTRITHLTMLNSSCAAILALSCGPGAIRNSILASNNTNMLLDKVSAPTWSSDHNVLTGTTGPWGLVPAVYLTHEWFATSGQDRHSVYVVPSFADPQKGDFHPDPAVCWGGGLPGMGVGASLDPEVKLDRDGKPFQARNAAACAGAYNYPDPQPGPGWKKLPVTPGNDFARQNAGIYKADGTLVRMLVSDAAGVRELWWDGLDDTGQPAPAAEYQVRTASHDVRLLDDGNFGDNGNPLGTYNCDNPERIAVLPDGRFVVATVYDEAGIPLRFHEPSGQSVAGVNLAEKDIWAIVTTPDGLIAGIGGGIARITLAGERTRMANGAERYPILTAGEKLEAGKAPAGLAVARDTAYVALPGLDIVRSFDLKTGQKKADWKLEAVADLAADGNGVLWAISGQDVVSLKPDGSPDKKFATGLKTPRYLSAGQGKLAVTDRAASRIALLDAGTGQPIRVLGKDRPDKEWAPVSGDVLANPRGTAFLPDGRLLIAESSRVRALWPETGQESFTAESNFMDVAVPHPLKPEYVYCHGGMAFQVNPATGAWTRKLEAPGGVGLGGMATSVVLDGRPFIVAFNPAARLEEVIDGKPKVSGVSYIHFIDVTDPLKPRLSTTITRQPFWAYASVSFTKEGHLVLPGPWRGSGYSLSFTLVPCKGLDAGGNPSYDFENTKVVGPDKDPSARGMGHNCGFAVDPETNDFYYMAVTAQHNKMVPAWGASGSGVGKSTSEGTPLWFSLSSGGNYTSMDCIRDRNGVWVLAGKDFGGQVDVYDSDGLRLATSNWSWNSNWQNGFIDLRFGIQAFLRADGRPGVFVEDDNIGRFTRLRLEGTETLKKTTTAFPWEGGAPAGQPPVADRISGGKLVTAPLVLPKVPELKVDGDWAAWAAAGVQPQVISLPAVTWGRSWPDDLFQTFRAGTSVAAFAHDGKSLYAYFVLADDTMHFDSEAAGTMWMHDSVELWLEEEQIGIGFLKNGKPALFKYRYHNREGKEWSANYALPDGNVWGQKYGSLDSHPLGRQLAEAVGVSFEGKSGYALMAKIPFEEIKLVGGIAARSGKDILPTTGSAGEIIRIGVAFDHINCWGREQDYKVYWPYGLMFSDPTRNVPFVFGQ
jgi:hypothetical protein